MGGAVAVAWGGSATGLDPGGVTDDEAPMRSSTSAQQGVRGAGSSRWLVRRGQDCPLRWFENESTADVCHVLRRRSQVTKSASVSVPLVSFLTTVYGTEDYLPATI